MLTEEHAGKEIHSKEFVPARNPNDATLSVELNDETPQRWCLMKGRTCQILNRIFNKDIGVCSKETYIQLGPLNP